MNISSRIKYLKHKAGLSQLGLANVLGISPGNISSWEIGKAKPGADALIILSEYFLVSTDWLLTGVDYGKITRTELEFLNKFNNLDEKDKEDVRLFIEIKFNRGK